MHLYSSLGVWAVTAYRDLTNVDVGRPDWYLLPALRVQRIALTLVGSTTLTNRQIFDPRRAGADTGPRGVIEHMWLTAAGQATEPSVGPSPRLLPVANPQFNTSGQIWS